MQERVFAVVALRRQATDGRLDNQIETEHHCPRSRQILDENASSWCGEAMRESCLGKELLSLLENKEHWIQATSRR
jgi:hypothetical protein